MKHSIWLGLSIVACVASPRPSMTFETSTTASDESTSADGESSSGSTGAVLDVGGHGPGEIAEVFGHSGDSLWRVDTNTKAVAKVGNFSGVLSGSIIDIALDADSNMYGTAFGALYAIDKDTAACTLIAEGSYPTSLSFVPAGAVDPDVEALVGYVDADYIRIDVDTGAITDIGALTDGLQSSGDIVSVKDGPTYLTVKGDTCVGGDCLVVVDPATGDVLVDYGELPWAEVFGLAFWGGTAYGFASDGTLFAIDFEQDGSLTTTPIQIPGNTTIQWYGAGSTTSAPPQAP